MVALRKSSTEAHGSQVLDQQGRGRAGSCQILSPVLVGRQPGKEERGIAHGLDSWGQHSWSWDGGGRGSQDLMLLGQGIQWPGSGGWGGAEGSKEGLRQLVSVNANICWAKTGEICRDSVAVLAVGFFSGKAAGILCRTGDSEPWLFPLCN